MLDDSRDRWIIFIAFVLPFVFFLFALLTGTASAENKKEKPEIEYEFHSWAGMQQDRGGALDTGLGMVAVIRGIRVGAQVAQNRIGTAFGGRCLGINCVMDTRDRKFKPGIYVALSF